MPGGRPTIFSNDLMDTICERLGEGESLRSISRDNGMPSLRTIFRWMRENPEFRQQYAVAREAQAQALADDILDIADRNAPEDVNRDRLRVDSRKWLASKIFPNRFGDRNPLLGGDDDSGMKTTSITVTYTPSKNPFGSPDDVRRQSDTGDT